MSYLNPLRLHFFGKFQANVSTVNNDPGHFDNATFVPSYQDMQGPDFEPPNGWFNPQGDAAFRLFGCTVTAAWLPSGAVTSDPVLQCIVADSDTMAPAKLVDLDPEQQLVSEIWGLQVRIADGNGNTLMRGDYEPAAFLDIWDRAVGQSTGGDQDAGAAYQSVLTNLQWGDVSASKFLTALKKASRDGLLSIKFNVDDINMNFKSPDFMRGRIAGTIGPATKSEPHHMVLGRQFMASPAPGSSGFFSPAGGINFFPAVVDDGAKCIFLDLGNALSTSASTGQPNDLGDLQLIVSSSSGPAVLATIPSKGKSGYASDPKWYSRTAGVVALPLTGDQLASVAAAPLSLISANDTIPRAGISEWPNGMFVRADQFVHRLSPGDSTILRVHATQWGRPLAKTSITFELDPSHLQPGNFIDPDDVPPVGTPPKALKFHAVAMTDKRGVAELPLKAGDPGTPRWFNKGRDYGIDGQVYGIRPSFTDRLFNTGPSNQWNFISILLWSAFKASKPVTWIDVEPIFTQYANLYPVMNRFLNLANYESVVLHKKLLELAFGLNEENPNAMPVTRDLSPAKRQAILAFLADPRPGVQKKRLFQRAAMAHVLSTEEAGEARKAAQKGGKAAAVSRRLIVRTAKGERS